MSKRNELRDNIYQRMHGFKTVKRGYRKDGQSKWYYIDPRGAHSVEDMKEIDVPSENAPNPKLNDILADDMQKNPQDYYIWRTKKDDKVRGKHAEREGEIFNWHVPPEGGHPGEDYNCRCWAEPYKPERYADKPMIIDVSGILPENANKDKKIPEGSYITEQGNMTTDTPVQFLKLPETEKSDKQVHNVPLVPIPTPKPKKTESQMTVSQIVPVPTRKPLPANATLEQMLQRYILEYSPNLKQNLAPLNDTNSYTTELGNMILDIPIQFVSNQYISDEDLYARMWENIKRFENVKYHPYLDSKGIITIGGGANVNNWNAFRQLNAVIDNNFATEPQKRENYDIMQTFSNAKDANGNYRYHNMKADFFAPYTNIRISDAEARRLAQNHMNDDLAHLRKEFSDFDSFPLPLKEVLLDIQYNVKGGVNRYNWPNLYQAIQDRNVLGKNGIIDNVNRPDVQQERNNWAKDMVRLIRF